MRNNNLSACVALLALFCSGCHHSTPPPPVQAQAPPLQTGKGTLSPPQNTQQAEKTDKPLASPLPQPSAQSVPLPPPKPKKVHKPKPPAPKPEAPTQTAAANSSAAGATQPPSATTTAQAAPTQQATAGNAASPIGQLTIGDSAMGEKTKRETSDLVNETQQGLNGIKRPLSDDEKTTAAQIRNYLKQAQQALDNGDTEGAYKLATKAKLLLDELTKP